MTSAQHNNHRGPCCGDGTGPQGVKGEPGFNVYRDPQVQGGHEPLGYTGTVTWLEPVINCPYIPKGLVGHKGDQFLDGHYYPYSDVLQSRGVHLPVGDCIVAPANDLRPPKPTLGPITYEIEGGGMWPLIVALTLLAFAIVGALVAAFGS